MQENNTAAVPEISEEELQAIEMEGNYLTFWTDKQLYGVPIADVVQIVGMQEITLIPDFPAYAKGVINLRGSIIPVVDVRLRFHLEEAAYNERTCIIVTNIDNCSVGFIVDEVDEVIEIPDELVSSPPRMTEHTENVYLTGIGRLEKRVALLLDTAKLLSADVLRRMASTSTETK